MPKVYLASDHAGFQLKEALTPFLREAGHEVEDCGALSLQPEDDYPDFILPCARKVAQDPGSFGIILGASGQGEAMAANRVPGARCAVYYGPAGQEQTDAAGATLSLLASVRAHNDANMLSLGARFLSLEQAQGAVASFLAATFGHEERHVRRIGKLDAST